MIVYEKHDIEDVYDLDELCWSGARDRVLEVEELDEDKQEQFMEYIRQNLDNGVDNISLTQLNDFIWFECDRFIDSLKDEEEED